MSPHADTTSDWLRHHPKVVIVAAIVVLAGLLIGGFIAGRGEATEEAEREQPVKPAVQITQNPLGPPTLVVSPELQREAGIELTRPRMAPYQQEIQAFGSIIDLQSFTDVSNTVASANAQRAVSAAKLSASRAAFQRAQTLYKNDQNFSRAQLQAAEVAFRSDEASLGAAQVQALNAASSADQAWGPVLGESLAANTALAQELIQHKKVLVQVTLPLGTSLPQRQPQRTASIETSTGERVHVEFVSAAIRTDPKIQGSSFFYTADAASGVLPGMNVIALLPAGQPVLGVAIPASAVLWLRGRAWIYLRAGENAFSRHEIPTTQPQPGGGYIVPAAVGSRAAPTGPPAAARGAPPSAAVEGAQGFPANTVLVAKGAQALLSQEFSSQIQLGED